MNPTSHFPIAFAMSTGLAPSCAAAGNQVPDRKGQ
jgi:hypothetical protein